jgi:hypothetical protein
VNCLSATRCVFAVIALACLYNSDACLLADDGLTATVRVRLVDDSTDEITPAMICITGTKDGEVRLPPDGRANPPLSTTFSFTAGVDFRAGNDWVGPVRKTTGLGNNRDRSYVYETIPSLPYWNEPVMYQTSGDFSIRLPEGNYRIAVHHGCEFVPVVQPFEVDVDELEKEIRLKRWIDLAAEGWISGDVHVHHPTVEKKHRDFLLEYAKAEDVRLVNVLQQHSSSGTHSRQAGFGKEFRVERDGRWLISGQETPSFKFGHVMGLNISHYVDEPIHHHLYDLAFDELHRQEGALVGYAHFAWNGCLLPRGFPWYVTTEKIDFVEVLQFAKINTLDYYDYLNMGFRLVAAAGSDVPWGSTLGEVRTYVHVGGDFDPDRWFAGLKAGRSFVTNGPALDFTIDRQLPGATIARKSGRQVVVRARVRSHAKIGLPISLQLVSDEGVLKEIKPEGNASELRLESTISVDKSQWFVASARCANGAIAHSSPIYVVVDGMPTWSPTEGPQAVEKQLAAIQEIQAEYRLNEAADHRDDILKRLDMATAYYKDLQKRMQRQKAVEK